MPISVASLLIATCFSIFLRRRIEAKKIAEILIFICTSGRATVAEGASVGFFDRRLALIEWRRNLSWPQRKCLESAKHALFKGKEWQNGLQFALSIRRSDVWRVKYSNG